MSANIGNLKVFLAIYDTGSLTQAARLRGMSQSGASAALARLRSSLQDELFVKTKRGMTATARANEIVNAARQLVEAAALINTSISDFDPMTSHDDFKIMAGDVLEGTLLTVMASQFRHEAPHVTVGSYSLQDGDLEDALASGRIDICAGFFPALGTNILQTRATEFSFGCYCDPSHPWAGQAITTEQLKAARFLVMGGESNLMSVIDRWLKDHQVTRNVVFRTAHFEAIPRMLAAQDLLVIVPTSPGGDWYYHRNTSKITLPFDPPTFDLNVYWHRAFHADPRNRWIRQAATDALRGIRAARLALSPHQRC